MQRQTIRINDLRGKRASYCVDENFIEIHAKKIGVTAVAVYDVLVLCSAKKKGTNQEEIAERLGISRSSVYKALRVLDREGIIALLRDNLTMYPIPT